MAVETKTYGIFIGGKWQEAETGRTFAVRNPATGETLAHVADGGVAEIRRAIEAAHAAFPSWAETTADRRAALLSNAARLMIERREELARILTQENGKPLAESLGEIASGASFFQWNAEEARRVYGEVVPTVANDRRVLTIKQPIGVVGAITPWNFPFSMVTRKLGPALAAGCTAVLRPARATPLVAIEIFKIMEEVGFPPGVVNLVTGTDSAGMGRELATNPLVRKLTFTGSTEVGKQLLAYAAGTVKRVSLELGGHAPFLVFDDADLDKAAQAAVLSRFRNAGQTCICTNRVFVQRPVADAFTEKVARLVSALRVGNGLEPGVQVGPLIDERGFQKVVDHVEDARSKGATVVTGGRPAQVNGHLKGYFYEPTVLANATPRMKVMYEETFGPVLPIMTFETEDEAIALANDTPYGLAAYFYARDVGRIFRVAEKLEYGIIGANDPIPVGAHIPFGGFKESGLGRENGSEGINHFLEVKAISIGL
ncbi:MAG TPA: NAD-dependent succinate-semialdehyde dehydrogenase [Chloroflexota bacterium]|nr:NAD-dependent succinate-semialdehyde dehydrogenase [Chloroflexota bacterium]